MDGNDYFTGADLGVQNGTWDPGVRQKSPPAAEQEVKESTPEETRRELSDAIVGSNEVLVGFSTALTLFPDKIVLDRAKLTVNKQIFMNSRQIVSMRIEDILNITATVGPVFGRIEITSRVINSTPFIVGRLWRKDALQFKRVVQGYIIALQRNIDCNALSTLELRRLLSQLGEDEHRPQATFRG